jgi:hypothetical protein
VSLKLATVYPETREAEEVLESILKWQRIKRLPLQEIIPLANILINVSILLNIVRILLIQT